MGRDSQIGGGGRGTWQHWGHSSEKDMVALLNEFTILQDGLLSPDPSQALALVRSWIPHWWGGMLHILPRKDSLPPKQSLSRVGKGQPGRRHLAPTNSGTTLPFLSLWQRLTSGLCDSGKDTLPLRTGSPGAFYPRSSFALLLPLPLIHLEQWFDLHDTGGLRADWHDLHGTVTLTAIWRTVWRLQGWWKLGDQSLSTVIPSSDESVAVHTRDDKGGGRNVVGDQTENTEGQVRMWRGDRKRRWWIFLAWARSFGKVIMELRSMGRGACQDGRGN